MERKSNKNLLPYAKELRNNMTKEEKHLWYDFLRNHRIRFSRQKIIGRYIVDFYSFEASLVIELDGSQHYEKEERAYDQERTRYLEEYGLKVIRIDNREVNKNFSGVCAYIDKILSSRSKLEKGEADD